MTTGAPRSTRATECATGSTAGAPRATARARTTEANGILPVVAPGGIGPGATRYQPGISPVDQPGWRAHTAAVGRLGIGVLGPLTVDGNTGGLAPRDRVVLAALALRPGEVVSAETLADALWGGQPPTSWKKVVP